MRRTHPVRNLNWMLIFSSFLSCKIPSSRNKSAYGLVGKGHCIAAATQHRSKHQILTADKNTILLMASRPIYVPITPEGNGFFAHTVDTFEMILEFLWIYTSSWSTQQRTISIIVCLTREVYTASLTPHSYNAISRIAIASKSFC